MDRGEQPIGGCSTVEKRGSEEGGLPEDAMLEHADASEMCISEMTVILMSLEVTAANFKVAESFCRNKFGDLIVGVGFERGIIADHATSWVNDNVDHQRLYATE